MDVLASMDVLVLLIKTRASSPDATSLLFHSLPLLTRFQGYHPRENSGIKDACRRVLEHLIINIRYGISTKRHRFWVVWKK